MHVFIIQFIISNLLSAMILANYLLNILPPGATNLILATYNLNHLLQAEASCSSHFHGKL
jgi:hypothetical protein